MAPARLLVAVDQRLLVGGEEHDPVYDPAGRQGIDHGRQRGQVLAPARVAHHRRQLDLGALQHEQLRQRADHLRREVVDAEVARVLEDVHGARLARPGEARDDHEVLEVGSGVVAVPVSHRVAHDHRPVRLRWLNRSRATFCGKPGTFSSASREALSTASGEPKCLSSARLRAGPMPGSSSMIDSVIALSRRMRWWVIAKRCASSRTRWTSCSAGVSWAITTGVGLPGRKTSSMRLASETTATPRSRKPCSGSSPAPSWPLPPSMITRLGSAANEASRSASYGERSVWRSNCP